MLGAHLLAMLFSGSSAMSTPISQLSRGDDGIVHTVGLVVLALLQPALALLLWRVGESSRLWQLACVLMMLNTVLLLYVAYYFASAPLSKLVGPNANDPLALLASNVGVIMGCLLLGLKRRAPRCASYNLVLFVVWLGLVPVIPFIDASWLGAYERVVGASLLTWFAVLALFVPSQRRITS
jgi:hypothetical protein